MQGNRLLVPFVIGIACIAAAVAGIFYMQRGAHVQLQGSVLKIRTAPLDENSSAAVVDFRFTNPSDYRFVVRTVTVIAEDPSGGTQEGSTVSDIDAQRLFDAIPLLGQKYNSTLIMQNNIPPHATEDRMVAARFEMPEARLEKRKRLIVRIEDVDGPVSEISESSPPVK
jgi:hypothetical protein